MFSTNYTIIMILSSGLQIYGSSSEVYRSKALKQENYENVPKRGKKKLLKKRPETPHVLRKSFLTGLFSLTVQPPL